MTTSAVIHENANISAVVNVIQSEHWISFIIHPDASERVAANVIFLEKSTRFVGDMNAYIFTARHQTANDARLCCSASHIHARAVHAAIENDTIFNDRTGASGNCNIKKTHIKLSLGTRKKKNIV